MNKEKLIEENKTIIDTEYYLKLLSIEKEINFLREREKKVANDRAIV